jgi:hypothetical protein
MVTSTESLCDPPFGEKVGVATWGGGGDPPPASTCEKYADDEKYADEINKNITIKTCIA